LLFANRVGGAKGLPIGAGGRVLVLLSGGYDSAVAAWRMLRHGLRVDYVFCNLGGGAYERLVLQLAKVLNDAWGFGHSARLHVVDFTAPVEALRRDVPRQYWQVVLKRHMYRAASAIADECDAQAIVTGEALGQVSSQTLANLCAIEAAATRPVLRPLIAHEKQEILEEAERIGTAALSRRVREYCAIGAQHPVVATTQVRAERAEVGLNLDTVSEAVRARRMIDLDQVRPADLRAPYLFADSVPLRAQLIDCQDESAFAQWHAPGATHWDPVVLMDRVDELDRSRTYLVYCAHGVTSAGVAEILQQRGFEAYAFAGGVQTLRRMVESAA
jgi:thiamine biosynthesis protein ThiI